MAAFGNKLTPRQAQAVAALLREKDVSAAAKAARVGERTLYRWLTEDADFQRELRAAEGEAISAAVRRLADLAGTAVETLSGVMLSKDAPLSAKVRAADIVLSRLLDLRQMVDLGARVADLEDTLKAITNSEGN